MKTLITATLYTCLTFNGSNVCQYKNVQTDKDTCRSGTIEQKLPRGSDITTIKIARVCKG